MEQTQKKTAVVLRPETHKRIALFAAEHEMKKTDVVEAAVQAYLPPAPVVLKRYGRKRT